MEIFIQICLPLLFFFFFLSFCVCPFSFLLDKFPFSFLILAFLVYPKKKAKGRRREREREREIGKKRQSMTTTGQNTNKALGQQFASACGRVRFPSSSTCQGISDPPNIASS